MIEWVPPVAIFILGALLIPFLKGKVKQIYMLLLPLIAFMDLLYMSRGTHWVHSFLGYDLIFGKVDTLSLCFGYVFVIMAFLGTLYAIHVKENGQHIAAFFYIGASLGVVFAGDLLSLFIFWEIMAFSSVFLIWYQKDKKSLDAGFRYILVHAFGGSCLLAGIVIHLVNTGSIEFALLGSSGPASSLILVGFLLNAAVPPLHAWLSDAYPEGTVTGSVFLTAFTTKTAVYVLIRGFPGVEILIWLGAIMTLYGVVFAVIENDIRRLLAYHIISQVGYMVCGVGMGTMMAINGATAHAFTHILYKALLFMGAGAVIQMTGRRKLTELGGVYKIMPLTFIFYMVGGLSISAFPLFSGFVSKSMVIEAAALDHRAMIWLMLTLASVGTFFCTTLKLPYFTFFSKDKGIKATEPPKNMLLSMGLAAFLCIFIGVYPQVLYNILPYPVDFVPYTASHVVGTMQLLLFTALAFWLLIGKLGGEPKISLDMDWFYRKAGKSFLWFVGESVARVEGANHENTYEKLIRFGADPIPYIRIATGNLFMRTCTIFSKAIKYPYATVGYASDLLTEKRKVECIGERAEKFEREYKPAQPCIGDIGFALFLVAVMLTVSFMYIVIKHLL